MDQPIFKNLEVDEISGNYFKTASKWALFISIVYIACILLLTVMPLTNSDKINTTYNEVMTTQQVDLAIGAIIAILIIAFAIILVITYFFLLASIHIKRGVTQHDQAIFNSGLGHLKNGLMLYGILALIGIAINIGSLFL
jgi:hypothetical protein